MKKEEVPWSAKALFICTKCHKAIPATDLTEEGNCGENLKNYLKGKMKEAGKLDQVRVMTSSCLNVCEPGVQAVLLSSLDGVNEVWTLHPEKEKDELLARLE